MRRGRGAENVLQKLERKVDEGDFYEALQIYKTLYSRHLNNQEADKAREIALAGCIVMIKHRQFTAAAELSNLILELFNKEKVPVDSSSKGIIKQVDEAFAGVAPEGTEQRIAFLRSAVRWSSKLGSRANGDPEIQLWTGNVYRAAEDYGSAVRHYLHAEQPTILADTLVEWSLKGYKNERDLFLARAIFQLLSLENLRDANLVYERFMKRMEEDGNKVDTPLTNYLNFLLQTLQRDALPLFQMLEEKYAPSLARDPSFRQYLGIIGQKFYGLQPPATGLSALMNLLGGGM